MTQKYSFYYILRKIFVSKVFQFFFIKMSQGRFLRKIVFYLTYKTNHWNKYKEIETNNLIVSGPGSIPGSNQTNKIIKDLDAFIKNNKIKSVLDMPCGDFSWMSKLIQMNSNVSYTGYDIVKEIIDLNNKKFSSDKIKFFVKDIVEEKSFDYFDFVFVRDFFIHIMNNDIIKILNVIKKSKIKFFACSSSAHINFNKDVIIGRYRQLNIEIEPFYLDKVFLKISDGLDERYINIYKLD